MIGLPEDLPRWVWDVVADIVRYEGIHGKDWPCIEAIFERIPEDIRRAAAAISVYRALPAEIVEESPGSRPMNDRECFDPCYLDGTAAGTMDCPFCEVSVGYSEEDPDSAFSDLLHHIQRWHPDEDQAPAALWPRIEIKS